MALQVSLVAVLLLLLALSAASTTTTTKAPTQALPGCYNKCGNLTIPYPFGMKKDCYLRKEFFINCNDTTQPPVAYLGNGNLRVTDISVDDGDLQILGYVAKKCYNALQGRYFTSIDGELHLIWLGLPYTISHSKNKFYAVGCDTSAVVRGFRGEEELITGCMSVCNSFDSVDKNSCSGVGCCKTNIPSGLKNMTLKFHSYQNNLRIRDFNPCSYAFIVEQGQFNFSPASFKKLNNTEKLPMVLNWAIGNDTDPCDEARKRKDFACRANSLCINRDMAINESVGYLCKCSPGYEGNPYHPDGCQDIDECKASINPCIHGTCINLPGNYSCLCHKGYKNDRTNAKVCLKLEINQPARRLFLITLGKTKQQCLGDGGNRYRFRRPPRRARHWASIYNILNLDIFLLSRHLSLLQSVLRSVKTRKELVCTSSSERSWSSMESETWKDMDMDIREMSSRVLFEAYSEAVSQNNEPWSLIGDFSNICELRRKLGD